MRRLRKGLRGWRKNEDSWYRNRKKELLEQIDAIDIMAETHGLSTFLYQEKKMLSDQLASLFRQEEIKWIQRAKEKILKKVTLIQKKKSCKSKWEKEKEYDCVSTRWR